MPANLKANSSQVRKPHYEKHYTQKDYILKSTNTDGSLYSVEVDGKVLVRRRDSTDKQIYYLYCINERRSRINCPCHFRICLPIRASSKVELMRDHNSACLKQDEEETEDDNDLEEEKSTRREKSTDSNSSCLTSPGKDDSSELIDREVEIIVTQEPEITEKELRSRLELRFKTKKLPSVRELEKKITRLRRKLGTNTLDYVRRKDKTVCGYPFLRYLSTIKLKIDMQDTEYTSIIWMSNFQMLRLRSAQHIYVDGSFDVVPQGFKQLITILAEDPITKFGIPVAFLLLDSKTKVAYELAFQALKSIATSLDTIEMNLQSVTHDFEKSFFLAFRKVFNLNIIPGALHKVPTFCLLPNSCLQKRF